MCYSALVWSDYRTYVRDFNARISIKEFYDLFYRRLSDPKISVPKAIEAWFSNPTNDDERQVKELIDRFAAQQQLEFEQRLFQQRTRLANAERKLQTKTTDAALNDQRIATNKIRQIMGWIDDLKRTELREDDSRIYPMHYVPVIVLEDGQRVVKPMRYQCLPAGKAFENDRKFPGTYNARRDSLNRYWKTTFGTSHGVMLATKFFENVETHRMEGRELRPGEKVSNTVLEFQPRGLPLMVVACLWSQWTGPEIPDGLLSFAAITDEPPAEVSAAGHDRCIVPIRAENLDAWLQPNAADLNASYAVLDDRERPYYEHRLAA
ncbi:SOS response-associated peptidase family protein [Piscinibacter sp. HJYY11]|uniref:SOS response-associated peptidase family protein n=1 Tax=Piscinibacter sp. HJYY11 TaxID=2801333 RepID=UPI00191D57E9|nr:SOS response-associated peptidase family protein [Piscinibacter sp. HJYY11]MBL0726157.1 SOS response-associated peptidase family protein [Piscinibacter sp. HJYY11]